MLLSSSWRQHALVPLLCLVGLVSLGCSGQDISPAPEAKDETRTPPPTAPLPTTEPPPPPFVEPPSGPPGVLDPSFGDAGWTAPLGEVFNPKIRWLADGSFVVAGTKSLHPSTDLVLARFDARGKPMRSFGVDGSVTIDLANGSSDALSDVFVEGNRIWVVGTARMPNATWTTWLVALDTDGKLDTTYAPKGQKLLSDQSDSGGDAALLLPGGLLAVHPKTGPAGELARLVRYDRTGAKDPSFVARDVAFTRISNCNNRTFGHYGNGWTELDAAGREAKPLVTLSSSQSWIMQTRCSDRHVAWIGVTKEFAPQSDQVTTFLELGRSSLELVRDTSWGVEKLADATRDALTETNIDAMAIDAKDRMVFVEWRTFQSTTRAIVLRRTTLDGKAIDRTFGTNGEAATKRGSLLEMGPDGHIYVVSDGLSVGRYSP